MRGAHRCTALALLRWCLQRKAQQLQRQATPALHLQRQLHPLLTLCNCVIAAVYNYIPSLLHRTLKFLLAPPPVTKGVLLYRQQSATPGCTCLADVARSSTGLLLAMYS